jgi:glycosyltransferase involved in cell wall biosynthesis
MTQETHGLLVPPAQPTALADAMVRLLTDGALANRLTRAATQRIRGEFAPQARVRHLQQVYMDLVSGKA